MAHSIFKRWRPLFQSNELYREINHVLEKFGNPFLALFEVRLVFENEWSTWQRGANHLHLLESGQLPRAKQEQ